MGQGVGKKIIERAKKAQWHDMTIIPPEDETPSINGYRYGPEAKYTTSN
jgi:hypothetical protein